MMLDIPELKVNKPLRVGQKITIYKGIYHNQKVIVKALAQEYPDINDLDFLKNEYAILSNIPVSKGIPEVVAFLNENDNVALLLADHDEEVLSTRIERSRLTLKEFLNIGIQLAQILGELHIQGVIHKDINPDNIVLDPRNFTVKLIDFGIATRLSRETQSLKKPEFLEGTLPYLSPEQTGRMNRGIDYRTDLYSLGATFYQLLTGKVPFIFKDPLDMVYSHLAKMPIPPIEINPTIPQVISDIVMKLLNKQPEDRYQNAFGLKHDLENCLEQLETTNKIKPFPLGKKDVRTQFQISQKLYGREQEIKMLLDTFDKTLHENRTSLMLVYGYSGVGKSALVKEIHKSIVEKQSYFAMGKFNPLQKTVPFHAWEEVFNSLVNQTLTASEEKLGEWKQQFLKALSNNGQIIIDHAPELEIIIGKQPQVPDILDPIQKLDRFHHTVQKFLQVFASPQHPLVIFLDDLQWAGTSSIKLIEMLVTQYFVKNLLLIVSYRENEVDSTHPLAQMIKVVKENAKNNVHEILVRPLDQTDIKHLIADSFNCSVEFAEPLAEIFYEKTQGNPFFINQLLQYLYNQGLINFNPESERWEWDIDKIRKEEVSANVVDLMINKFIYKLPEQTRTLLSIAACIGYNFELKTLSELEKVKLETIREILNPAFQEGLIVSTEKKNIYKFLHDNVQEATYQPLSKQQRQFIHYKIGKLLLNQTSKDQIENNIFQIIKQLNAGKDLITDRKEKLALAKLNLMAANRALNESAGALALTYSQIALEQMPSNAWESEYSLIHDIYEQAARAAFFASNYDEMNSFANILLEKTHTLLEKIPIYELQIFSNIFRLKNHEALHIGITVLNLLGMNLSENVTKLSFFLNTMKLKLALSRTPLEDMINVPLMIDPYALAIMRIIPMVARASYISNPPLWLIIQMKGIVLTVKKGISLEAGEFFALSVSIFWYLNDYENLKKAGELSLKLMKKFQPRDKGCNLICNLGFYYSPWTQSLRKGMELIRESAKIALDRGVFAEAGYATNGVCYFKFKAGFSLKNIFEEYSKFFDQAMQLNQQNSLVVLGVVLQACFNLMNEVEDPGRLNGTHFNENAILPLLTKENKLSIYLEIIYMIKANNYIIFNKYNDAFELTKKLEGHKLTPATYPNVDYCFLDSIARLALYTQQSKKLQTNFLKVVNRNQKKLRRWATWAPMNYLHKYYLVKAELLRVQGKMKEAEEFYELAIAGAKENGFLQDEALSNELAAKFYLSSGKEKIGFIYLNEAQYTYLKWGAMAKVLDLRKNYLH